MNALTVLEDEKNRWALRMVNAEDENVALAAFAVAHVFVRAGQELRERWLTGDNEVCEPSHEY